MIGIFKSFQEGLEYLFRKIGFDEAEKSFIIGFFANNPELVKVEKLEEVFHFATDKSLKNVDVFLSYFFEVNLDKVFWAIAKASEAESIITSALAMETYGEVQGLVEEKRYSEALEKFKILYTKKRLEGQKDKFYISYGICKEERERAEKEAIKLGIIKENQAYHIENNINNEALQIALEGIKDVRKSVESK
jgi:hypothetical protein